MVKNRKNNNSRTLLDESVIRNFARLGRFNISEQFKRDYLKEAKPEEEDETDPMGDMGGEDAAPPTDDFGGEAPMDDAGMGDMGDMGGDEEMAPMGDEAPAPEGATGTTAQVDVEQLVDEIAGAIERLTGVTVERVGGEGAEGDLDDLGGEEASETPEEEEAEHAEGEEAPDEGGELPDIDLGDEEEESEEKKNEKLVEAVYHKVVTRLVQESKKAAARKPETKKPAVANKVSPKKPVVKK